MTREVKLSVNHLSQFSLGQFLGLIHTLKINHTTKTMFNSLHAISILSELFFLSIFLSDNLTSKHLFNYKKSNEAF